MADQAMSALLRDAAGATNGRAYTDAMSELTATLATVAVQGTATGPLLLTLDRSWPTDSSRLDQALDTLESTVWVSPTDFSTVVDATPGSLTLQSASVDDDRLETLRRLVGSEQDLTDFASAVQDPASVTAPRPARDPRGGLERVACRPRRPLDGDRHARRRQRRDREQRQHRQLERHHPAR
ncbi:DUF6049 family protein [Curtobacterium sp. MCJR17_043]|nr:DUF6049 family protein [Curtobacterium sp. MCJR17_043]WIB36084.1 DUF6049 family protein [Curtobacterium sp. MCJR17_043]